MDVAERVRRRLTAGSRPLVVDRRALGPVTHLPDPVGRAETVERLLDHLDPALDGGHPPDGYLWGPRGAGKSAVVTALFDALAAQVDRADGAGIDGRATHAETVIHTATRSPVPVSAGFVYVDARTADSEFSFYRALLLGLTDESVPSQGVGTDELIDRLREHLDPTQRRAVVAVDHVAESTTVDLPTLRERLRPVTGAVAWLAVGRTSPSDLDDPPATTLRVEPYSRYTLVDVVSERAARAFAGRALTHDDAHRIARRAEGDAGTALSVLFGAADRASAVGADRLRESDVADAIEALPRSDVSLGQVLALPENRKRVLRELVALESPPTSVRETAETIAADLSLSPGTVTRFLYELAEAGITERVTSSEAGEGVGRPPSRIEPRFPALVFRRLYDVERG